jgi:hypothetical protein
MVSNASELLPEPDTPVMHHQLVAGQLHVEVAEVVLASAADFDVVERHAPI